MPVRCDGRLEHAAQVLARRGREEFHVGHIEPDDETEPVGEIEIERVRNLDVAAQRVEAHRFGVGEALLQKLGARRPAFLLGMPVLIEGAEHDEGLAVQEKPAVLRLESSKSDDSLDRIDRRVVDDQFDDEIVKVRRFGRPGLSAREGRARRRSRPESKMIDQCARRIRRRAKEWPAESSRRRAR